MEFNLGGSQSPTNYDASSLAILLHFAFRLQPVFGVMAVLAPALQIEFVGAAFDHFWIWSVFAL